MSEVSGWCIQEVVFTLRSLCYHYEERERPDEECKDRDILQTAVTIKDRLSRGQEYLTTVLTPYLDRLVPN